MKKMKKKLLAKNHHRFKYFYTLRFFLLVPWNKKLLTDFKIEKDYYTKSIFLKNAETLQLKWFIIYFCLVTVSAVLVIHHAISLGIYFYWYNTLLVGNI